MEIILLTNKKIFASNCYLLLSENCCSVIDPSVEYSEALKIAPQIAHLVPKYVLLTHGHLDHMWEIKSYIERGFEVLISSTDAKLLTDPIGNCDYILQGPISVIEEKVTEIDDGDVIDIGDNQKLLVMNTPGHTQGSVCYISNDVIFTGDTLFAGGIFGRCDLLTSDSGMMKESLSKLFELNETLIVYPGHGASTVLGKTKSDFLMFR